MSHAIEVAGIQQIHADIDGSLDGRNALGIIGSSVYSRHAHATKTNGQHCWPRLSKFHGCFAITGHVCHSDFEPTPAIFGVGVRRLLGADSNCSINSSR